ncbi:MAG: DNA polymerase III subunit gamma/tau [Coriobacteriia bacterium]|nr:DNA polymerase III subunit gamma/tau [Coriobacteriia bacterium]
MAEALYRKYRPQVFSDVVGQEHIERTIRNAIEHDKTSHAYLFTGPRGTGKTTTARLLAKALLCEKGPTAEPDGACQDCLDIANGVHPDVYELDAASRTGVDNVREEIIGRVQFAPTRGRYKIYIIDEVHMLSTAAFNALLKTLEEPPSHVVFILCTTDPQKVPETIHSRCQRFDFHRISNEAIIARLGTVCGEEGIDFEPEALELIAYRAEGGMRNALTSLEQLISFGDNAVTVEAAERMLGSMDSSQIAEIVDDIARRDAAACFNWTSDLVETGTDLAQFVRDLAEYVRNLYVMSLAGTDIDLGVSQSARAVMAKQVSSFGPDRLSNLLLVLGDLSQELRSSTNPRLSFEIALTRMVRPESDLTLSALAQRVEALERALASGQVQAASVQGGAAAQPATASQPSAGMAAAQVPAGVPGGASAGVPQAGMPQAQGGHAPSFDQGQAAQAQAGQARSAIPSVGAANIPASAPGSVMNAAAQAARPSGQQGAPGFPQRNAQARPAQAAAKLTGAQAALAAVQAARDAKNGYRAPQASSAHAAGSAPVQASAPARPQMGQARSVAQAPVNAVPPQAQAMQAQAQAAQSTASPAAQASAAEPQARAQAANAATAQPSAGQPDISNPANLQRLWRAVTTAIRKANPARGVLFMNAKVSASPVGAIEVGFAADNKFAYDAAAKPEVTQLLAESIRQVAGADIPFELKLLGTSAAAAPATASAAPVPAANPAAVAANPANPAAGFARGTQAQNPSAPPASFTRAGAASQAAAPAGFGSAQSAKPAMPNTSGFGDKPASEPQAPAAADDDRVPLDIYDSFASSYDEPPFDEPSAPAPASSAAAPAVSSPVPSAARPAANSQGAPGAAQVFSPAAAPGQNAGPNPEEDARIEQMFNDAFGGGVRFYDAE